MRTRRANAGFTLVELMIVVTIIGVGTALSSAGVADTFSEMRASRAALELVRIGRRAKVEASGYMRAHMVWIQPTAKRVSLIRGTGWSCTNENWVAQFTGACGSLTSPCIEQVSFGVNTTYTNDPYPVRLDYALPGPVFSQPDTALCYAPNGRMYSAQVGVGALAAAGAALTPFNTGGGGFMFSVRRMEPDGTTPHGVTRWVVFPQGAPPRVLR